MYIVYIQLYPTKGWDLYIVHSLYTAVPNHEMGSIQYIVKIYSCSQPQDGVYTEHSVYPTARWDLFYIVHSLYTVVPNYKTGSMQFIFYI